MSTAGGRPVMGGCGDARLILRASLVLMLLAFMPGGLRAAQPGIEIVAGDWSVTLLRSELLQRGDLTSIHTRRDATCKLNGTTKEALDG